jgi:hypothetical protein
MFSKALEESREAHGFIASRLNSFPNYYVIQSLGIPVGHPSGLLWMGGCSVHGNSASYTIMALTDIG